ncbi:D-2-hydroxyacid dehydrogenase [Hymenobacter swuensis]|uniref:D-isomer specific 2-hydroxyacid dehydrogenase NAD-binding protein n=1 Tax=Hymenobacter swuensis DY53 TaxID=1227739 RepID=W8EUH8_9BACT|nr:D-2-hydroxyacid dehydrogenase [Hymenobacter swuensis]AHJ96183.1 D-isomer specific 2-hydroxyacid dehydrogenase NAD-binding protein [Hymenobacter swuensis DY53]
MHLFVYSALSDSARTELLRQLPAAVRPVFRTDIPADEQPAAFQAAELLLGNPPPEWFAPMPPALRFWQIDSAGIDRYQQLQPAFPVANMGDFFAWPCAETMVAGLLGLLRYVPELAVWQAEKRWVGNPIRPLMRLLRHQRVVVLGSGAIGQAVAQQLTGFGCHVQFLARTDPSAQLHSREQLQAVLPHTDIVVNCLPGSADGFFSADLIAALPEHALYASVGRGNTTDEPALIVALQSGRLGGAVLDVTAQEPLPANSPLWNIPRVLLTQHSGGGQPGEDEGKVAVFLRNLRHLLLQEPLENKVQLRQGY